MIYHVTFLGFRIMDKRSGMRFANGCTLFCYKDSPYSQFYPCNFKVDKKWFNSAEQFFQYQKAITFKDYATSNAIMRETDPNKIRKLGRKVSGYDETEWSKLKYDVVLRGNYAKFSQHPRLKAWLLAAWNQKLAFASKTDTEWGIGLHLYDRKGDNPENWNGNNLLGKALMEVRDELLLENSGK